MSAQWLCYHLFYHARQDVALVECVRPMVEALSAERRIGRFFFLRYWNGGPHLRLRFRPVAGINVAALASDIEESLSAFLARCPSVQTLDPSDYFRMARLLGEAERAEAEPYFGDNRFEARPYVPENDKYGEGDRLDFAEAVFDASSRVVLQTATLVPERRQLIGVALTSALTGLAATGFDVTGARNFFENYSRLWMGHVSTVGGNAVEYAPQPANPGLARTALQILCDGRVPAELTTWHALLATARARTGLTTVGDAADDSRLTRLLTHFFHTHANRLGLLTVDEALIGRLGAGAFVDSRVTA